MPVSMHSHSGQFCMHATGTLEDVVREAISQGFETYGLTEHVPRYRPEDLYPEETVPVETLEKKFDAFLDEARRLKTVYTGRIRILVGLETEYISEIDLDALSRLLARHSERVEYIVGSVHHVNGIPIDFDRATFDKAFASVPEAADGTGASKEHRRMEAFLGEYFDAQYTLLSRFRPEVVGHFDLCRLYSPALRFADYPHAWEKARRNIRFAVAYGALFELNAAALRKGWDTTYPGEDVVQMLLREGARFTLSDDSHGPHAVGLNYRRLFEYAKRVGIVDLWTLERAERLNAVQRGVTPRRISGDWRDHSFWSLGHAEEDVATSDG